MVINQINLAEIKELIPHREPFLYIEKLIDITKLSRATGIKLFNNDDSFFNGHFPGHPVVPGVILIEMMAQTAAALIAYSIRDETFDKIVYLMNVENTKFRKPVFPGETIKANVAALRSKGRVWRFEGKSINEKNEIVCNAQWSAMIMDKNSE
jgi:3-hydroxyacyl-[acyl-carrier-protein] dehydratase